jgi:Tol biopolymer transport system component
MTPRIRELTAAISCCVAAACIESGLPERQEEEAAPDTVEATPDFIQEAVWSADGRRLVASWHRGGQYRLYGLHAPYPDGSLPEPGSGIPITSGDGMWATWAPDGLWVAFATRRDGNGEVYRVRPDGTGPENLTRHPANDGEPAYSPDGRRIVFTTDREEGGPSLWIMAADGSDPRPLAPSLPGDVQYGPAWSPDGTRIAFYASQEGEPDVVWITAADGSATGRLGEGGFPAWSADGERIYFDQNDSIFWRPVNGGGRRLVVADGFAARPSPDGKWISFVRGGWPMSVLYLLSLDSGMETRITP